MDLLSRGNSAQHADGTRSPRKRGEWIGIKYLFSTLVIGGGILLLAVIFYMVFSGSGASSEAKQIKSAEYQAVFLNNGQVYFGKIKTLNTKVVIINDVYYIEAQNASQTQSSTAAANNNYTLRKLGTSELHAPEDAMIINRDQVTFWENIKDSGRVVTAIKQYQQNPNASSQVQSTGQSSTPTANQSTTTTPTTKKP